MLTQVEIIQAAVELVDEVPSAVRTLLLSTCIVSHFLLYINVSIKIAIVEPHLQWLDTFLSSTIGSKPHVPKSALGAPVLGINQRYSKTSDVLVYCPVF